jgi:hypothetical protein
MPGISWEVFPGRGRCPGASLLSGLAVGEFADDVEVANVPGVLLKQVEQDPVKRRRIGSVPPIARPADVSKIMGLDDGPGPCGLGAQHPTSSSRVSPAATYQRPSRLSAQGSATSRPSKPHSSHRSSTQARCLSNSIGVQPDGSRLRRNSAGAGLPACSPAGSGSSRGSRERLRRASAPDSSAQGTARK